MSIAEISPKTHDPAAADTKFEYVGLADGVVLLLGLTVVQRMVGFARGVLFCRWLDAEQLGRWDLAFSFLFLAAPLIVLGLPGSFGRYAERYRQQGQLQAFLRRTLLATLAFGAVGGLVLVVRPHWLSWLIFDNPEHTTTVYCLIATLMFVVTYNYLTELFTALRQTATVSLMHFSNSLLFALIAVLLLVFWHPSAIAVIIGFGTATALTVVAGVVVLIRLWGRLPSDRCELPARQLWHRLLPYAGWIWAGNLATNLFDVVDRYMILHFSRLPSEEALVLVGNYHSSRIIPLLLVSVSVLLGGLLLPHLSYDWEMGRRRHVDRRLNLVLKLWSIVLILGATTVLLASGFIFNRLFSGKFGGGLAVLPWTLTYCSWAGMEMILVNYLWCTEKARLPFTVFTCGLVVNIVLNFILLPYFGLLGAVVATSVGHLTVITLTFWLVAKLGMRTDPAIWCLAAAPLTLCIGKPVAAAVAVTIVIWSLLGTRIFKPFEKRRLVKSFRKRFGPFLSRFGVQL